MSDAARLGLVVPPARADVTVRPTVTLAVAGSLRPHAAALDALWSLLQQHPAGRRLRAYRVGGEAKWRTLGTGNEAPFSTRFGLADAPPGGWQLDMAERPGTLAPPLGVQVQWRDHPPVLGLPRASLLRLAFDPGTAPAELTAVAEAALRELPFWWGTAGPAFDFSDGSPHVAARRIAAEAKRHWGVDIPHPTAEQWSALDGLTTVHWLTLVGTRFADRFPGGLDALATAAAAQAPAGLFVRRGLHGLAIAAGPAPLTGDINRGDDLTALAAVARLLAPLRLAAPTAAHTALWPDAFLAAWMRRFDDPDAWLACRLDD